MDDFREAYFWLRQNTDDNARYVLLWTLIFMISRSKFPTLQLFAKVADIQMKHTFLGGVEKDQK